jgi:hypothetical protein
MDTSVLDHPYGTDIRTRLVPRQLLYNLCDTYQASESRLGD